MKNKRKPNPQLNNSSLEYPQQIFLQTTKDERLGILPTSTICQKCTSPINMRDLNQSLEFNQRKNCKKDHEQCQIGKRNLAISVDYEDRRQIYQNMSKEDQLAQIRNLQKRNMNDGLRSSQIQSTKSRSNTHNKEVIRKSTPTNTTYHNSINHSKKASNANYDQLKYEKTRKSSPLKIDKKNDLGIQLQAIDNIVEEKVKQREKRLIEKENTILQLQEDFQRKVEELDSKLLQQFTSQQQDKNNNDHQYSRLQFGHSIPLTNITNNSNQNGHNLITSSSSIDGRIFSQAQNESQFNGVNKPNTFMRNSSEATTTFTNNQNTSLYSQNGLSSDQLHSKQINFNNQRQSLKYRDQLSEENLNNRNRIKTSSQQGDESIYLRNIVNNNNNSYQNYEFLNNNNFSNNIQGQDNLDDDLEDITKQQNMDTYALDQSQQYDQQIHTEDLNNQYKCNSNNGNFRNLNANLVLENLSYSVSNKNSHSSKVRSTSSYGGQGQIQTPNNAGQYLYQNNTNPSFQNSGKQAYDALNNTLSLNNTTNMLNQTLSNNNQNFNQLNNTTYTINDMYLDQKTYEKQKQLDFIDHEMRLKERAIKEKKEQLSELEKNIVEKKEFIRKYTDNYERLREGAHQVKIDLKDEEKFLEKIKEEKKKELEQTKALKAEQLDLNEKITETKAELVQVEAILKEKEILLKEKNEKLSFASLQLQQTESQIETQMIMIRQQTEQIEVRFKQLNDLSVFIDKERRKLQQKESEVENINQNCIAIREQNEIKEKQLKKKEEDVYRMQLHLDVERTGIEELKKKLKGQESILASDKKKIDEKAISLSKQQQNFMEFKEQWENQLKEKEENLFQREGSIKMKEDLLLQQSHLYEDIELKMQGLQLNGQLWEKKCQVDQQNIIQLQKKYTQGLSNSASASRTRKTQSGDFSHNKENELFIKTNTKTNLFPPSSLKLVPPSTTSENNLSSQKPPLLFSNTKIEYSKQPLNKNDDLEIHHLSNTPQQKQNYGNQDDIGNIDNNENKNINDNNNYNSQGMVKSSSSGQSKTIPGFKNFNKK